MDSFEWEWQKWVQNNKMSLTMGIENMAPYIYGTVILYSDLRYSEHHSMPCLFILLFALITKLQNAKLCTF